MTPRVRLKTFLVAGPALFAILIAFGAARSWAQLPTGAITPAQVNRIVAGIQVLRELKFESKVPISYLTPDQTAVRIRAEIAREKLKGTLALESKAGAMLGLYPPNLDLAEVGIGMLKREIAGFYDPRKKDLVIVESPPAKGANITRVQKLETANVIAHELTHGLQDQNFNIGTSLEQAKNDDDRSVALSAVVEGDATLAGFAFIAGRMDDEVLNVFVKHIPDMEKEFAEKTRDVPLGVREPFIFQYMYGARFVAEAYHRNGWSGVDALYVHPPANDPADHESMDVFRSPCATARGAALRLRRGSQRLEAGRGFNFRRATFASGDSIDTRQRFGLRCTRQCVGWRQRGDSRQGRVGDDPLDGGVYQ
jgi:hypothetical protein